MAKVTRTKLARGTKLTPDHTHGMLADCATQLNSANISVEQLEASESTFRVNWNVPYLATNFQFDYDTSDSRRYQKFCIPFTLPPAQD